MRTVQIECCKEPVVRITSHLEFQCAQRVGNVLERVHNTVGVIVGWIDAPLVANVRMRHIHNTIGNKIPHGEVGGLHVNLASENSLSLSVAPVAHVSETLEIHLNGGVSVWRLNTLLALRIDGVLILEINVCQSLFDELHGELIHFVKVLRRVGHFPRFESKPFNHIFDALKVLVLLLRWIGVIVAQVAVASLFGCMSEGEIDCLCVSNVQETIWLWWETSHDLSTGYLLVFLEQMWRIHSIRNLTRRKIITDTNLLFWLVHSFFFFLFFFLLLFGILLTFLVSLGLRSPENHQCII
mmetsp:Transcript_2941/g.11232  ORF Transcript_2941/g.11232 Transcript_2941/m.11232 type:complete len:297 (-) Transcript_2941:584-1474(-)